MRLTAIRKQASGRCCRCITLSRWYGSICLIATVTLSICSVVGISAFVPLAPSIASSRGFPAHYMKKFNRILLHQSSSATDSQSRRRTATSKRRSTVKRSLRDRTPAEAVALIQDLVRTALEAGPRAGPARTLQAARAVAQTANEFIFDPTNRNNRGIASLVDQLPVILRTLFERMGATYVKLGQFIASSPTLFPAEYVKEFQKCLDQTEPLPWSTIKSVLEAELGPLSQTFSFVDERPLASASIAQVHAARLLSGEDVVVKVQKPGIDNCLQADLGFIYVAARVLEYLQPDWERTSLSAVASDIRTSMLDELDFVKEARNTIEFRRYLLENGLLSQATAPLIYQQYTTRRVLTMERLRGVSMLDEDSIRTVTKNPDLGAETIITALNIWSLSVTTMPWFHADVHAGNLLLLEDGRVGFIDFGIVGRISPKVLRSVQELSAAVALNDSEGMAIALCNMGAADETVVDTKQFGLDIERVLQRMSAVQTDVTIMATEDGRIAGGRIDINESDITNLLLELVEVTENNGLRLPREFGLLVKQVLYFDRYLKILAPDVDVMNDDRLVIGGEKRRPPGTTASDDKVVIDI